MIGPEAEALAYIEAESLAGDLADDMAENEGYDMKYALMVCSWHNIC
jgi:hypothetical protein